MRFRDDNGLFAIVGHRQAAWLTSLGLHALRHRGRAACGMAVSDGTGMRVLRGTGSTEDVFESAALSALRGALAVGQVHSHAGEEVSEAVFVGGDLRPVVGRYRSGSLAVALAGRITNGAQLRREMMDRGRLFHGRTDAELIAQLVADSSKSTFVNRVVDALWQVQGAYSLIVATEDRVVAVRDPRGFRPLVLGRVDRAHVVASDDAPIDLLGGDVVRELEPGELAVIETKGVSSVQPFAQRQPAPCALEPILLSGPGTRSFGLGTQTLRESLGARLAADHAVDGAEVVVGLPGAAAACAVGFAQASGLAFHAALIQRDTAGTVARPPRAIPSLEARLRWTPVPSMVTGRRVVLVVPDIGTGRRVREAVELVMQAGAVSVDVRSASAATTQSCRYGVSSPVAEELAMPRFGSEAAVATWLGARSVAYLSSEALEQVLNQARGESVTWCQACINGVYPLPPEAPDDQLGLFDGASTTD